MELSKMLPVKEIARIALLFFLAAAPLAGRQSPGVTFEDIVDGLESPSRWLTYSGNYSGDRHSPLTQITPGNVNSLAAQWTFQAGNMPLSRGWEGVPLVVDGVLYVTGNDNYAWAAKIVDAGQQGPYRDYIGSGRDIDNACYKHQSGTRGATESATE